MIIVSFIVAICLSRVYYMASKFNMKARWNGFGALRSILDKTADAPMIYRPLAAWILRHPVIEKYELLMVILTWAALYSVYLAIGQAGMFIFSLLITATFWYDYWDVWPEIIGIALSLVSFPLALLGVAIHGLSRETAPLCGLAYALHSGDWIGGVIISAVGFLLLWLVRRIQGKAYLYCDRWMIEKNVKLIMSGNVAAWISIYLCFLSAMGAVGRLDGIIPIVLIGAGWTMAKGDESRVFSAALIWAAIFLEKFL